MPHGDRRIIAAAKGQGAAVGEPGVSLGGVGLRAERFVAAWRKAY